MAFGPITSCFSVERDFTRAFFSNLSWYDFITPTMVSSSTLKEIGKSLARTENEILGFSILKKTVLDWIATKPKIRDLEK